MNFLDFQFKTYTMKLEIFYVKLNQYMYEEPECFNCMPMDLWFFIRLTTILLPQLQDVSNLNKLDFTALEVSDLSKIKAKGSDLSKAQPRSFKWTLFPLS